MSAIQQIVAKLRTGEFTSDELCDTLNLSISHVRNILREIDKRGLVHVCGYRKGSRVWTAGHNEMPADHKRCSRCSQVMHLSKYRIDKRGNLTSWCIPCIRAYKQEKTRKAREAETREIESTLDSMLARYQVKEVAPGHRSYRVAGGWKPEHRSPSTCAMQGYQSGLAWIK